MQLEVEVGAPVEVDAPAGRKLVEEVEVILRVFWMPPDPNDPPH